MRVLPPAQRQASLPSLGRADLQPVLRRASNGPDRLPFRLRLSGLQQRVPAQAGRRSVRAGAERVLQGADRKSTRLNSSHSQISYAVFCLKKKTKKYYV